MKIRHGYHQEESVDENIFSCIVSRMVYMCSLHVTRHSCNIDNMYLVMVITYNICAVVVRNIK